VSFLVIDVGTSTCRAALVSEEGRLEAQSSRPMVLDAAVPPLAEVDCRRVWEAVREVVREVAEGGADGRVDIRAVGVSAMLGYVLLGRDDEPLAPAILYLDNRAGAEAAEIQARFSGEAVCRLTGRRISPELLAPKLLWLKKHRPGLMDGLGRIIGLKDEIVRRLTGRVATDLAHADYSMLFNVREGRFQEDLIADLGLDPRRLLPPPRRPQEIVGGLTPAAARGLGLKSGLPVVCGSSDGTTAMYGGGVLQPGRAALVSGTTDVLMTLSPGYLDDPSQILSQNSGPRPGVFLVGGAMGLSGGALARLQDLLGRTAEELEEPIGRLPPGAEGLLVLPGLTGERAPYWQEGLSGAVIGLTPAHGPEHLLRALMEGTAYRLRHLLRALAGAGLTPRTMSVSGGCSRLEVWNRIRADVTGLEVIRWTTDQATCLGAALFCRAGLEGGEVLDRGAGEWLRVERRYRPNPRAHRLYQGLADLFERYILQAQDLHRDLRRWTPQPAPRGHERRKEEWINKSRR